MSILHNDARAVLDAFSRSQAIIEFNLDGKILAANENFCSAMGYAAAEIVGQHHSMFVKPDYAASAEYREFWASLREGKFDRRQYKRVAKGGREVWIEASYNPVMKGGKPYKVVKSAVDITAAKLKELDEAGKLSALSRAEAIIEFDPQGRILTANENFLSVTGYALSEVEGKHHQIFCESDYARSPEYQLFWQQLRAGEFKSSEFARVNKRGEKFHIQASYNPIFDDEGRVMKVVKFAVDVTGRVKAVDAIAAGLERLASCNIRVTLDDAFIPELERLRHDFNKALGEFQRTLVSVLGETSSLNANSQSLSDDARSLGHRTEQQAASLEEASAALQDITLKVRDASARASDTRDVVKEARKATSESVQVVQSAIDAIGRIDGASKEIGNIIDVIDQIAFQTNLLALNAGVEAARAGEAGKGFAVVAQEVRELAQRSAKAAREISELITNSAQEVAKGVKLVSDTGEALSRIEHFVDAINSNVDAIANGASEQASSLTEINNAVNQLDQVTQQNSALVSSIGQSSVVLSEGAAQMQQLVELFKLNRRQTLRDGTSVSNPAFRKPVPAPVQPAAKPVAAAQPSPARQPTRQYASGGGAAAAAQNWEEF
ncbi:methyl-accepting chemotaxis protein [Rhizobium sp.]